MIIGLLAILIITADQLVKFIALKILTPGETIPVIKSIFHITLVLNKGGAFGIFRDAGVFFIVISVVVISAIAVFLFKARGKTPVGVDMAFASIAAGALSNLVDRLRFGCVVDFFDFRVWPVFNIADSAITIGVVYLCIRSFFRPGR